MVGTEGAVYIRQCANSISITHVPKKFRATKSFPPLVISLSSKGGPGRLGYWNMAGLNLYLAIKGKFAERTFASRAIFPSRKHLSKQWNCNPRRPFAVARRIQKWPVQRSSSLLFSLRSQYEVQVDIFSFCTRQLPYIHTSTQNTKKNVRTVNSTCSRGNFYCAEDFILYPHTTNTYGELKSRLHVCWYCTKITTYLS